MKNIWKFLNGPLISAAVAGSIIWGLDYFKEKESRDADASLLASINELSKSHKALDIYTQETRNQLLSFQKTNIKTNNTEQTLKNTEDAVKVRQEWNTVLDVSWAKKGDKIDVEEYASFDQQLFNLFVNLDDIDKTSASFRITDENSYKISSTLSKGEVFPFEYNNQKLRLKVIDIRAAGFFGGLAMYFTIEKLKQF